MRLVRFFAAAVCLVTLAACGGSEVGPPAGWTGDGTDRWWRSDADTTGSFRSLETLEDMGVQIHEDVDLASSVQNRIIGLYRSNPEVLDSLFAVHGLPIVEAGAPDAGDRTAEREALVTAVNTEMARYYRQALVKPDPPLEQMYPDSLRNAGVGGQVVLQIRVDEGGNPFAIEKIEGVHPTLDALAMRAATKLEWTMPWVVTGSQGGRNVPSWTRLTITY
ncbi:MAG: hypothetical protein HKN04_13615 [Rhodothermaceae bacterium]|nr:hypothetical protein [Rhodothermaceae bacterium]